MSLTFKILSLVVRTAAKPIGNSIKSQAKDHEGFRRFAVGFAQRLHRVDMRMRLGLLHDTAAQERMHEQARKAAEKKKVEEESTPTVRTEADQKKHDADAAKREREGKDGGSKPKEEKPPKVRIRPLSESKAIELGANFISETFIFAVAIGLLLVENWRSRRKETARRDDVKERLSSLEEELERLRDRYEPGLKALSENREQQQKLAWYNPAGWWSRTQPTTTVIDGIETAGETRSVAPSSTSEGKPKNNATGGEETDGAAADLGEHAKQSSPDTNAKDVIDRKGVPRGIDDVNGNGGHEEQQSTERLNSVRASGKGR